MKATPDTIQRIIDLEQQLRELKLTLLNSTESKREIALPLDVLVFQVMNFSMALPVARVEEVASMVWVNPLPKAPAVVRGAIHYRGELVPVMDLRYCLAEMMEPLSPDLLLVLARGTEHPFALVVDRVEGVITVQPDQIAKEAALPVAAGFVQGVFKNGNLPTVILNPDGLHAAGELDLLKDMLSALSESQKESPE